MGKTTSKHELIEARCSLDNGMYDLSISESLEKRTNLLKFPGFLEDLDFGRCDSCEVSFLGSPRFHRFILAPKLCSRLSRLTITSLKNDTLANLLCKAVTSSDIFLKSLRLWNFSNPRILDLDMSMLRYISFRAKAASDVFWFAFYRFLRRSNVHIFLSMNFPETSSKLLEKHLIKALLTVTTSRIYLPIKMREKFTVYQEGGLADVVSSVVFFTVTPLVHWFKGMIYLYKALIGTGPFF